MSRQADIASQVDADAYVERLLASNDQIPWALTVDDRLVGLVAITVDRPNLTGWFWYWMTNDARGRGWMARAAAMVANWALADGGLERLELGHRVNNPASGAIARAAGFVREGTERGKFLIDGKRIDVDTYGRLRTDPAPVFESLGMTATLFD